MSLATSPLMAALTISTAATFFLFWGLRNLLALDVSDDNTVRMLLLYAAWPGSFIFFAGYPDSLAIALIVWSIYLARTDRWWPAALSGSVAALTKAIGGVAIVPLLVLAWGKRKPQAWPVLLVPAASAGYEIWLRRSGHPLVSSAYSHYWKTHIVWPWVTLWDSMRMLATTHDPSLVLNLLALVTAAALLACAPRRLEYLLYSAALLLLFLVKHSEPPLQSSARYILAVFPSFIGLGILLQQPKLASRFGIFVTALFILNLAGMYLFLKWSLVF